MGTGLITGGRMSVNLDVQMMHITRLSYSRDVGLSWLEKHGLDCEPACAIPGP